MKQVGERCLFSSPFTVGCPGAELSDDSLEISARSSKETTLAEKFIAEQVLVPNRIDLSETADVKRIKMAYSEADTLDRPPGSEGEWPTQPPWSREKEDAP